MSFESSHKRKAVHRKVYASAGSAGVIGSFVLWLTSLAFDGPVPEPLSAFELFVVTLAAGYIAKSGDNHEGDDPA